MYLENKTKIEKVKKRYIYVIIVSKTNFYAEKLKELDNFLVMTKKKHLILFGLKSVENMPHANLIKHYKALLAINYQLI